MLAAVVGGNLQGVEACYLAGKAGWRVLLIDMKSAAPAVGLCDEFRQVDATEEGGLEEALNGVDLIVPALENESALRSLWTTSQRMSVPAVFDPAAYAVSSSKVTSNRLFKELGIATPPDWPGCGFPVVAKPVSESGSRGVRLFRDHNSLAGFFGSSHPPEGWVVQEYIEGPSYSLEVVGHEGCCFPLQVTDLAMDPDHDCKRVSAPSDLSSYLVASFEEMSVSIGSALELNGIMDVEVILNGGRLHVLEIDARLPSQTPTAVFWSTGLNLLGVLGDMWTGKHTEPPSTGTAPRGVILEHLQCRRGSLRVKGEHVMAGGAPLHIRKDFFGADEALTDFESERDEWVATLIVSAEDRGSAWAKRERVIARIMDECNLSEFIDAELTTGTND